MKKIVALAALLACVGAAVAVADTHEDRETLMKQNMAVVKALSAAAAAPTYDPAMVKAHADILIANAQRIPGLFAPGTEDADHGALPTVWSDAAGFKAVADKMGTDALALESATDGASLQTALKLVQSDCGACHSAYRPQRKPH